jgi:hypothetical protein
MRRSFVPLLLVVVALGLAACGSEHPRVVRGAPPPPNAAELRKLAHLALQVARGAGDAHPTDATVVPTTRRIAEAVDAGSGVGYLAAPAYFVVVHGTFEACNVPLPSGAACPTGTILTLTVDPRTNESSDGGVESRMPDVNKIGKPEPLPLG